MAMDYEGARDRSVLPRANAERYNVVGRFRDPAAAEGAVSRLRGIGFADADASLLGSTGDVVDTNTGMGDADGKAMKASFRDAGIGIVLGAVLGAIVGVVFLALPPVQSAIGTHVSAGGYIAAAIFGAIIGLTLGGLVGGIGGLDRKRSGTNSYLSKTADGVTLVGVRAEGDARVQAATDVLRAAGAASVDRV